jgi:hypothetical protein
VHATQFFEFVMRIADEATDGTTVRLPPVLFQPMAADDVAQAVGRIAVGEPLNGTVDVAGPQQFRFDELIRQGLARATIRARLWLTRTRDTSEPSSTSVRWFRSATHDSARSASRTGSDSGAPAALTLAAAWSPRRPAVSAPSSWRATAVRRPHHGV